MPLLTQPAALPPSTSTAEDDKEEVEETAEVEEEAPKKGKKGKGGGGGKKGKSGKGKKEEAEPEEEAGEVLLIDEIWPKKEALGLTKWYVPPVPSTSFNCHCNNDGSRLAAQERADNDSHDRISIYTVNTIPLFVQHFDGPFIPTLKLLHRCKLSSLTTMEESAKL